MSRDAPTVGLRPLDVSDAEIIAGWAADPTFCQAADWSPGRSPAEHAEFHRAVITAPPAALLRLGVVEQARLVGYVDLHGSQVDRRELGFVIGGRDQWGRGLGRAAASAAIRHGFTELGLRQIWAEAVEANVGSIRILRRIGMRETGPGEPAVYLGIQSRYHRFALTQREWAARQAAGSEAAGQ